MTAGHFGLAAVIKSKEFRVPLWVGAHAEHVFAGCCLHRARRPVGRLSHAGVRNRRSTAQGLTRARSRSAKGVAASLPTVTSLAPGFVKSLTKFPGANGCWA